jgi:hypothetical protein
MVWVVPTRVNRYDVDDYLTKEDLSTVSELSFEQT